MNPEAAEVPFIEPSKLILTVFLEGGFHLITPWLLGGRFLLPLGLCSLQLFWIAAAATRTVEG
ncbi:hypothetical protein RchiOBHm_Chr4g0396701 [Rosa chinensis]|uniref:Uncharacterized protein n=1 Tax=Rosa chinensis TaxID=74649 RepID=A0A2P6QRX9_ROSCH|nr:hypothetical protein RchiOBHm_Chr4g0396701 [Rosa chinensis]